MRSNILTLTLLAGLSLGGAAFAGTTSATTSAVTASTTTMAAPATATGTITKINAKGLYIVLSDGWRYHVAADFSLKGFKVGEKVAITYEMKGKHHTVTAMTAA